MLNRTHPDAAPAEAFTDLDQYLLDELVPNNSSPPKGPSLSHYIVKLARLGGYLARAHDPPPGNTVIWSVKPPVQANMSIKQAEKTHACD